MPAYRINGKNVLFIHVPKTGGTTVERFLGAHSATSLHNSGVKLLRPVRGSLLFFSLPMQHFHGALLEAMFGVGFFDYAFMIVRDPLGRMLSEYRHSRVLWRPDAYMPFNGWMALALGLTHVTPNLRNNHFRRQVDFRCFDAEVFRFEDGMESIVERLARRLDLPKPAEVPHMKRTKDLEINVSKACAARVRRHFAADYEAFGY
jgi:hypothetical protein